MGDDPATSVTDPWGRVHGHDNLWVMDASVHVTNGPVNPVLDDPRAGVPVGRAPRGFIERARRAGQRARYAIGQGSAARATPPICSAIGRTSVNSGVELVVRRRGAAPCA